MRKESRPARSTLAALLIAVSAGFLGAEGGTGSITPTLSSTLPAEAPSSIFNAKLGKGPDADAELLVSGSWSATLISTLDFQAPSGSSLAFSSTQPFLFTQDPDLALSFLLYKKYFVNARVTPDAPQAMYSMGYRGGKGELLKELKVGNDGIDFPDLPFLSFGAGSYRSLGASVLVGSDNFAGKAMVRYDQASRVTKRFVGSTEVVDTALAPNTFVVGMFFLTYATPATNLQVLVQSGSGTLSGGDGNTYRRLDAGEYSYSATTGLVQLSVAATTRVLAYYPGSGADTTNTVSVAGLGACDWLYEPPTVNHTSATLSPRLGALNYYATTATAATAEVFVRNPSSGAKDSGYQAVIGPPGYIEVTQAGNDAPSATDSILRRTYRQPFSTGAAGMAWIYSTDFASSQKPVFGPVFTRTVVARSFSSSTVITIDKDFVAGSIEITRNGVPDYAFTANPDSGVLTFANPPSAADDIIVSYLKESSDRKSGIILGALGGFWDFGDDRSAWTALGASWSVPGSSYSSGGATSPGSISLSAGERDTGGPFKSSAALAARYSRNDSTGSYRIEGMESTSDYATSFQPGSSDTQTYFTATEKAETDLASAFPSQVSAFHSDGSVQKALQIVASAGVSSSPATPNPDIASYYKVEDIAPFASFGTFSFYAKLPPGAVLSVTLDDGAALPSPSASIVVPADPARSAGAWHRYALHYGKGDATVYIQADEGSAELALAGASSASPSLTSSGSRLSIAVSGLGASETAYVDEVLLQDSGGNAALLFQGSVSYENPSLSFGKIGKTTILSGLSASAFAQGALDQSSYASGGGSLKGVLGFVGLALNARALVSGEASTFGAGHTIELPAAGPVKLTDGFDYDPSSGAFGRSDSLAIQAGKLATLSLSQKGSWTPPTNVLDSGLLLQSWEGKLALGPSIVNFGLSADNRALPPSGSAPAGEGNNYPAAWVDAFGYVLPRFEDSSNLREATATMSVKAGSSEFLAASIGESASPVSSGSGTRADSDSIRLAAPFKLGTYSFEPYYLRSWKDQRAAAASGLVTDAQAALGDLAKLPLLYRGLPFAELVSSGTASDFADQSSPSGVALPAASYRPEAGLKFAREYGSKWYDLVAPASMDFYFGRSLVRAVDAVTDASVYSLTAKVAAINVFGAMGAYPLGLPFDSDEYLTTVQGELDQPRDGSSSSLSLMYHGLATLYAGQSDRFDAESKASIAQLPSSLNWTGSLSLALSRKLARDWLLDLYSLALSPATPKPETAGGKPASLVSGYLSDLVGRAPTVRNTWTLTGGLAGQKSDATSYLPGWSLSEAYETKLTVPERLTLKVDAQLTQALDAASQVFTLGVSLSINLVISF